MLFLRYAEAMSIGRIARAGLVATVLWTLSAGYGLHSWREAAERDAVEAPLAACKNAAIQRNDADLDAAWERCSLLMLPSAESPGEQRAELMGSFALALAAATAVWLVALALYPLWRWVAAGDQSARGR
jgi:hypothetical protein